METLSVLDLTFTTQGIVNKVEDQQVLLNLGSDYFRVLFTIISNSNNTSSTKSSIRFNTKKANWKEFRSNLISYFQDFNYSLNSKYINQELNSLGELFTSTIIQAANNSIPRAYKLIASKPWWNEELKSLRKSI